MIKEWDLAEGRLIYCVYVYLCNYGNWKDYVDKENCYHFMCSLSQCDEPVLVT